MARRRCAEIPADLVQGQQRFRAWRRTHQARTRIPDPLWDLAVQLAHAHGVSRTAAVLGLGYYSLKKRAQAALPGPSSPAFIELPAAPLAAPAECVIELEDGAGASLRVLLKGYDASSLAALGRAFWEAERCCKSPRR